MEGTGAGGRKPLPAVHWYFGCTVWYSLASMQEDDEKHESEISFHFHKPQLEEYFSC